MRFRVLIERVIDVVGLVAMGIDAEDFVVSFVIGIPLGLCRAIVPCCFGCDLSIGAVVVHLNVGSASLGAEGNSVAEFIVCAEGCLSEGVGFLDQVAF